MGGAEFRYEAMVLCADVPVATMGIIQRAESLMV